MLVRVLAIAHFLHLVELGIESAGEGLGAPCHQPAEMIGNGAVVGCGVFVGPDRQVETGVQGCGAAVGAHFLDDLWVVVGVDHDIHPAVILGRGPDHGGPAYVDVLDGIFQRAVRLCHRCRKRVQIDHHHVDGRYPVLGHDRVILAAAGEDATVDPGVQGFYPAVHHLRKAGVVRYLGHFEAAVLQQAVGAAGGQQLHPQLAQGGGEIHQAGFIGNAEQRALDGYGMGVSHGFGVACQLLSERRLYCLSFLRRVPRLSPSICEARVWLLRVWRMTSRSRGASTWERTSS